MNRDGVSTAFEPRDYRDPAITYPFSSNTAISTDEALEIVSHSVTDRICYGQTVCGEFDAANSRTISMENKDGIFVELWRTAL